MKKISLKKVNFYLTCNQVAVMKNDRITIEIYRGSSFRRNRIKVAEISFTKEEIAEALNNNTLTEMVADADSALGIPLIPAY
jgi:hypothetical protein